HIGATTGYRFYIPYKGDWPSLIRSLWNRMTAWELASSHAFALGGAMATTKEVFERARVKESWQRSADDDLALTTAVKALGLNVHFVPQCLVATHGDATLAEIVEWTNRQLILTKVYYPELWRRAILKAVILTVWLGAVVYSVFSATALNQPQMWIAACAGLFLLPIEIAFLMQAQGLWQSVLEANAGAKESEPCPGSAVAHSTDEEKMKTAFAQSLWRFSAVLPLAHLVLPWMTLYSVVTNRIKWRGITYELRGPSETLII
ncbi:MAG: glycosyltransferase, partial [Terriglobales bacterium]